ETLHNGKRPVELHVNVFAHVVVIVHGEKYSLLVDITQKEERKVSDAIYEVWLTPPSGQSLQAAGKNA
ncbi:Hypothetical predicted protein, partial [Paramuricea clavata]